MMATGTSSGMASGSRFRNEPLDVALIWEWVEIDRDQSEFRGRLIRKKDKDRLKKRLQLPRDTHTDHDTDEQDGDE